MMTCWAGAGAGGGGRGGGVFILLVLVRSAEFGVALSAGELSEVP